MRRSLLALCVAMLVASLLLVGPPASTASPTGSVDASPTAVRAPEPAPDTEGVPPQPRLSPTQRSVVAESAPGPQSFAHPAVTRTIAASPSLASALEIGTDPGALPARAIFLVLCSFLN